MKRLFLSTFVGLFLACSMVQAVPHEREWIFFDFSAGYRHDDLRWNAGAAKCDDLFGSFFGTNDDDRIVSKLKWSDMQIYQMTGSFRAVNCDRIYFRGMGSYGKVWHGHHKDKDVLKRKCECDILLLESRASSNDGEVFDLSLGVGYLFRFLGDRATLAPIAGYSHHEQHFQMKNLDIIVNEIDFILGHVPGLHSKYKARWYGPWAGMDFTLKMTCHWELYGTAEYHWPRFRGRGDWNLREDFVHDFRQRTCGYGQFYLVGLNYDITRRWKIGVVYNYQTWQTRKGKMGEFFEDGKSRLSLHGVHWVSQSVMGNIEFRY